MSPEREVPGVPGTRFPRVEVVDETASTNADLLTRASAGAPEGVVRRARHQTAGRGRQGRTWLDRPDSSLLVSWLLRPDTSWAPLVPLLTGLAVVEALDDLGMGGGWPIGLKWPNDVLVATAEGERKLAGILAEATTAGGSTAGGGSTSLAVVVGLGMNLHFQPAPPAEVAALAVDLEAVAEAADEVRPEVDVLLRAVLGRVDQRLIQLEGGRSDLLLEAYRERCWTIGRTVELDAPGGVLDGVVTDVDHTGGLVLRRPDGTSEVVTAGDAHHRRH